MVLGFTGISFTIHKSFTNLINSYSQISNKQVNNRLGLCDPSFHFCECTVLFSQLNVMFYVTELEPGAFSTTNTCLFTVTRQATETTRSGEALTLCSQGNK